MQLNSLMAQSAHGVNISRALCRQIAGEQSNGGDQENRACDCEWVERFHAEEKALQPPRGA